MTHLRTFIRMLAKDEKGATAIEYGLLAALISVAIIITVTTLGQTLNDVFSGISSQLAG